MEEIVAERDLIGIDPEGSEFQIMLKIGKPYAVDSEQWACPVGAIGLYRRLREVRGKDPLQALMRAFKLLRQMLEFFIDDGGRLLSIEDSSPIDVTEIFD